MTQGLFMSLEDKYRGAREELMQALCIRDPAHVIPNLFEPTECPPLY